MMPKLRGEEVANTIHEVCPKTPVILCTGYSDLPIDQKIKQMGISTLVMKPLRMKELALKMREVLDSGAEKGEK